MRGRCAKVAREQPLTHATMRPRIPTLGLDDGRQLWHLIERPRAPFRCDVCGIEIAERDAWSFTTLPKMFYETPPRGMVPCNRGATATPSYQRVVHDDALPDAQAVTPALARPFDPDDVLP